VSVSATAETVTGAETRAGQLIEYIFHYFHRYITANTLSTDEAINAEKSDNYLNSTYGDSEIMKEKDLLVCGVCRLVLLNV